MTLASMRKWNGLAQGHAYTLLGVYELKDTSGRVVHQLAHVRNPWSKEGWKGNWNDRDPKWTAAFKKQVPYKSANDGSFFMNIGDLITGFD